MQAVILAGGLGTRLRPVTGDIPKAMAPICGRPFLQYQLELLRDSGITDVVLCIGHRGDAIRRYVGDGDRVGLAVRYADEGDRLLGTAGALRNAARDLADTFFVTYGDGYLVLDYRRAMTYFLAAGRLGLMVVYKNRNRYDRSNVAVDGRHVTAYQPERPRPAVDYIDFGVSLFRRDAVDLIPPATRIDLGWLFHALIDRRQLLAFRSSRRFYEIGSPAGLAEFERLVRTHRLPRRSDPAAAPAARST